MDTEDLFLLSTRAEFRSWSKFMIRCFCWYLNFLVFGCLMNGLQRSMTLSIGAGTINRVTAVTVVLFSAINPKMIKKNVYYNHSIV